MQEQTKWEEQKREEETKRIANENKESKAMVLAKRDAGAQWQRLTNDAHWVYDAESDTIETFHGTKKIQMCKPSKSKSAGNLGVLSVLCLLSVGSHIILAGLRPHLPVPGNQMSPMNL